MNYTIDVREIETGWTPTLQVHVPAKTLQASRCHQPRILPGNRVEYGISAQRGG
jgi:hypothetical protein